MTVIRGATTIEHDDKEEIRAAVKELLDATVVENKIVKSEMLCIVFSTTSDIHSYYPAKAAREAGYGGCSLFSAQEPEIDGSLALCIRIMVFVEKNIEVKHVYLRGASVLRKDIANVIAIAIDGPAGSGKSTIARKLAEELKILYLDTGAMYRACALKALRLDIDPENEQALAEMMQNIELSVKHKNGVQYIYLDGKDVSEEIRRPEVSMLASTVSKHACVRNEMVLRQREIAKHASCVLDGRDIGSVVLPKAEFKFFLTASPEVRAKRRMIELTQKGYAVDLEKIKREIEERDLQDTTRKIAPLKPAEDAVVVDTSDLTAEEVTALLHSKIQEKI